MAKRKLTADQRTQMRAELETWNPWDRDSETAEQFAERWNVSRTTIFNERKRIRQEVAEQRARDAEGRARNADDHSEHISFLIDELARARRTIDNLEARLAEYEGDPQPNNGQGSQTHSPQNTGVEDT